MKKMLITGYTIFALCLCFACKAQKPSPAATVTQKAGDVTITINYSQPSVRGRTIGADLEPMDGKVWRTGANEATTFEVDRDVKVEGQPLAKGKYGLFTIKNGDKWTIIFNKTWKQWGAFSYKEADDALRITAEGIKADPFAEQLKFSVSAEGVVKLVWGDNQVQFSVK